MLENLERGRTIWMVEVLDKQGNAYKPKLHQYKVTTLGPLKCRLTDVSPSGYRTFPHQWDVRAVKEQGYPTEEAAREAGIRKLMALKQEALEHLAMIEEVIAKLGQV